MLMEHSCRQIPDEPTRRWMSDDFMDLIVWFEPDRSIHGFQLSYDKAGNERVLTWIAGRGFSHRSIEPGDTGPFANCTPILLANGSMPVEMVKQEYLRRSRKLEPMIRELVLLKLSEYESQVRA